MRAPEAATRRSRSCSRAVAKPPQPRPRASRRPRPPRPSPLLPLAWNAINTPSSLRCRKRGVLRPTINPRAWPMWSRPGAGAACAGR